MRLNFIIKRFLTLVAASAFEKEHSTPTNAGSASGMTIANMCWEKICTMQCQCVGAQSYLCVCVGVSVCAYRRQQVILPVRARRFDLTARQTFYAFALVTVIVVINVSFFHLKLNKCVAVRLSIHAHAILFSLSPSLSL